ncbi:MAG: DUF1566 domain-containing protein [Deltaproteobacteria bacterium]|nr:DUF1566 domain-containing protein [Deltaproteobacteria bacterium]
MNIMKTIFVITVALFLTTGQEMPSQAASQNSLDSDIYETINNLSRKLPAVIGKGVKSDKVLYNKKEIHIRRNFKTYMNKKAEREIIAQERPKILRACCSNETIRNFIHKGIPIYFDYYGKNGMFITSTAVDTDDCKAKPFFTRNSNIVKRAGRYIVYGNGIVKDTRTNLEWVAGPDRNVTWDEANAWAKNLKLAGGGWRLPTLKELETLYEKGAGPRNMTPCLKTNGWWVWSCETVGTREARSFAFGHGYKGWIFKGNAASERVFAVRSADKG